jgi:hypothetical protein
MERIEQGISTRSPPVVLYLDVSHFPICPVLVARLYTCIACCVAPWVVENEHGPLKLGPVPECE